MAFYKMDRVSHIAPAFASALSKPNASSGVQKSAASDFSSTLSGLLEQTSVAQKKAADLNQALQMDAPNVSLEQTVVAMNEASLQFQLLVQTRNKLVQSYNDIMNMPV